MAAPGQSAADDAPVFGVARGNGALESDRAGAFRNDTKRRRGVNDDNDDDVVVLDDAQQDPARVLEAVIPRIEQHVACPICTGVLYKPVVHTACGNSFCEACSLQLQQNAVNLSTAECSVCRRREGRFVPNVALRNVLETLAEKVPALRRNMADAVRLDHIVALGKFSG